jgi:hypothetical protein
MPRGMLPPARVRELGVALNGGKAHGWLERLSALLDTPMPTLSKWCAPIGAASSRSIPGAAATLLLLLVALQRRGVPPDVVEGMIEKQRGGDG